MAEIQSKDIMISARFENVVMTTFSQDYDRTKHFLIDESTLNEKESTKVAKRFCRKNKVSFSRLKAGSMP